ncbi:DcrB/PsbP domain-containing protein [Cellulosilyticum lentocellum]|uniref:Lipoprotein n=1 Tax=Cellulosilyticum lentocellum (strain ATCC 49066 / DSM 5427 / NCIMB 11756 / RHM5) TaxID=642492 RepID=F2JLD5_CELLD|nr:hypothetical protein [Cellulosilyticum lentocellum]ADZ82223.1 hypothetical protein Clole_0484 [Cellulosilyticum lentocellum DSM 5427]
MKQLKKFMAIFVVVTTAFCAGCNDSTGGSNDSNATSAESKKGVEAGETFKGDSFSFVAPKDWKKVDVQVMEGAISIANGNNKSMNVIAMEAPAEIASLSADEYKEAIATNLEAQKAMGITANKLEVQTKPYGDIVYAEVSTKMTEELIDMSIESGLLTQEAVDAIGGAEAYMKNMNLEQVCAYLIKDGKLLMITAQITGGSSIDDIKDEANFVIDNVTLK